MVQGHSKPTKSTSAAKPVEPTALQQAFSAAAPPYHLFYQSFLHSNDAMTVTETDGTLRYVNPAFTRLYGYTEAEVQGKNASILRHSNTPIGVFRLMWKELLGEGTGYWSGEITNLGKDGQPRVVWLTISPILGEDHTVVGYMSVAQEIGERKRMEQLLAQQEKLSSMGLLAAGLAHEVGTPLGVISGRAEMAIEMVEALTTLLPEPTEAKPLTHSLQSIVQQTDRIKTLVESLLAFSRGGTPAQVCVPIAPTAILQQVLVLLGAPLRQVQVAVQTPSTEISLCWDEQKCEQVFLNLIQNAIHALEGVADPRLKVSFKQSPAPPGVALGSKTATGVQVEVIDNGCGIEADIMKHLFDPFFTTKPPGMGTGLGLSVTHALVQEAGGAIWAESTPGVTTTFYLWLPLAPPNAKPLLSDPKPGEGR